MTPYEKDSIDSGDEMKVNPSDNTTTLNVENNINFHNIQDDINSCISESRKQSSSFTFCNLIHRQSKLQTFCQPTLYLFQFQLKEVLMC